jgi:hypothetical protein
LNVLPRVEVNGCGVVLVPEVEAPDGSRLTVDAAEVAASLIWKELAMNEVCLLKSLMMRMKVVYAVALVDLEEPEEPEL